MFEKKIAPKQQQSRVTKIKNKILQFHNGTNSEIDQKCTQKVNKKGLCGCETVVYTI